MIPAAIENDPNVVKNAMNPLPISSAVRTASRLAGKILGSLPRTRTTTRRSRRGRRPRALHAHGQGARQPGEDGQAVPEIQAAADIRPEPRQCSPPRPIRTCGPTLEEELRRPAAVRIDDAPQAQLEDFLLVEPGEDFDSVIVEIRAGTGGDEAALFAGDLYDMYTHYARDHGWKVEDISFSPGEQGGFKEVVFSVSGDDVYQHLRYESGGHRVQRVPKTETQGRIHTSAATVAVLPEPDEVQVEIKDSGHRVGAHARRRRGRPARQQDRERRPHLVQAGHAGRDRSQVPGRAQPAQELRPGHAHPAQPAVTSGSSRSCTSNAPSSAGP